MHIEWQRERSAPLPSGEVGAKRRVRGYRVSRVINPSPQPSPHGSYGMHTSDSIFSISSTKNVSHQSHLLPLWQYLTAYSGCSANPLKKIRFSRCVNPLAPRERE